MFRAKLLLPNALPNYTLEMSGGEQVKKVKANRPKNFVFWLSAVEGYALFDLEMEMKRIKGHKNL